jgi:hypothetical protein
MVLDIPIGFGPGNNVLDHTALCIRTKTAVKGIGKP